MDKEGQELCEALRAASPRAHLIGLGPMVLRLIAWIASVEKRLAERDCGK